MNDLLKRLYANEELWLRNIGCEILSTADGIQVSNGVNRSMDFNYLYPNEWANVGKYSNIKVNALTPRGVLAKLVASKFHMQSTSDVQLIFNDVDRLHGCDNPDLTLLEVGQANWCQYDDGVARNWNQGCYHFFLCLVGLQPAGKMLCIINDEICGIYDFEIFPGHRRYGYSSQFLSLLVQKHLAKTYFIQTWSENYIALKSYQRFGLREIDRYYYFSSQSSLGTENSFAGPTM